MKVSKTNNHLGQSISMGLLFLVTSIGIIGLITLQSGALK